MDTIQRSLVLTAAKAQPKMFSAIAACIDVGGTKESIMQKVESIAPAWGLTPGLCDAVCDFFISGEGKEIVEKAKAAYFSQRTLYENVKDFREKHGGGLGPEDLIGFKKT